LIQGRKCRRIGAGAAAAWLCLLSGAVVAGEPGFYIAVDTGVSTFDGTRSELDEVVDEAFGADFERESSSYDKQAIGAGLVGGYRFTPFIAAEVSYLALGKAKYHASGTATDGSGDEVDLRLGIESGGPAIALLGSWPLSDAFSLDARAGVLFSRSKLTVSVAIEGDSGSESTSEKDSALLLGVGGTWSFRPGMALRFGFTLFKDALGGEDDVGQASAGFQYTFPHRR
jgi:outer membrane autotransporter protein